MHKDVIFIAYQNQENLGVGYLSSFLASKGYQTEIIDWNDDSETIYQRIRDSAPKIVGFSLIFQYDFNKLCEISDILRKKGVNSHFTVGGHYPSLRYESVLDNANSIDSVVRFEGEITLWELVKALETGKNWKEVIGLAYRSDRVNESNELRPLIPNLDTLPHPHRYYYKEYSCMGVNCTFILGSRGCYRNCSFCSIRAFYGSPPGKLRRTRSPEKIVDEMEELYNKNIKVFLFQDDDFFSPGPEGQKWAREFLSELNKKEFTKDILWKINCRTDEVKQGFFDELKKAGLFQVYLGIESGNAEGLKVINKQLKVEDNLRGVNILKKIGLKYDFGFMLFDPISTVDTVHENISFLRTICGDGSSPIIFCKMLPYAGTPIEKQLINEGRLFGGIVDPDYKFLSPEIDSYYDFVTLAFNEYIGPQGLYPNMRWHMLEVSVIEKFYSGITGLDDYKEAFRERIEESNIVALDTLETSLRLFENGVEGGSLVEIRNTLIKKQREIKSNMLKEMKAFRDRNN